MGRITDELARQRSVVRASLDIPESSLFPAVLEARRAIYEHALKHAGEMPPVDAVGYIEWRNRLEAFEWLVSKRLYRETGVP